jgi:hypothetical protein
MPDRAICGIEGFLSHGLTPLNYDDLANRLGIAGENPLAAPSAAIKNAKSTSQFGPARRPAPASDFHRCRF